MIRIRATVFYEDGREETFSGGSVLVMAWEKYALRHGYPVKIEEAPRVLSTLVMAHKALGVSEGFDVWAETVASVEDAEAETIPPTQAAPISASDASSPSPSAGSSPPSNVSAIASSQR